MAHCILLVFPLADRAKAALEPILGHLQKAVICQTRLEASSEMHTLNFGELETTKESSQGDSTPENSGDPLAGKFRTTTHPTQRFQLDWVRLVVGRWLLSGLIIDFPERPLPFTGNIKLVACHSPRLHSPVLDLLCGRGKRHRNFGGFIIGNRGDLKGICFNICGSNGGLMRTNQKPPQNINKSKGGRTT